MSEAEQRKLEELQKFKAARKAKKEQKPSNDLGLPKLKADALPEIKARKGQFEMIPDFLQQKKMMMDMSNLNEMDMMNDALKKQDQANAGEGLSMQELF